MKVCTDACLFGAWTAQLILKFNPDVKNILDIGTGTGLLSLMLAQKTKAKIDAVEINKIAAEQANENFNASAWKNIGLHNLPIAEFTPERQYDLIITNPPFYEGNLLSPVAARNAAMHDSYLTLESLLSSIIKFISPTGYAAVLLPVLREPDFLNLLKKHNLNVVELTRVRQSVNHGYFRSMFFIYGKYSKAQFTSEISIHSAEREYTAEFQDLLKDYYLNL